MNRHILVASVSLGLAALCTTGCQKSGTEESSTDANRTHMTADASTYTVPSTASTDTPYYRSSTDTTAAGTLRSGDTVYLQSGSPSTGMVSARTSDGRIVWVRASDLRPK
jgi:hypothetical protein